MKKVALSDGSGNWFDVDLATAWKESVDAEEQYRRDREGPEEVMLYLTTYGSFILYKLHWSSGSSYIPINQDRATRWLVANGFQTEIAKLDLRRDERELEV